MPDQTLKSHDWARVLTSAKDSSFPDKVLLHEVSLHVDGSRTVAFIQTACELASCNRGFKQRIVIVTSNDIIKKEDSDSMLVHDVMCSLNSIEQNAA